MNLMIIYSGAFFISLVLALLLTPLIGKLAVRWQVVDRPENAQRKIHHRPVPLLGGWAIFIAVFLILLVFRLAGWANFSQISDLRLWSVFIGALLIMIGGSLDDKFILKPYQQIIWPLLAAALVVFSGSRINFITHPLGTPDNAIIYLAPALGALIAFVWLMGMMYTTKFLDGLDGLVSGIGVIAAFIIFLLSLNWDVPFSATGVWALILAGGTLGFWFFNWHPAKIFLGEGGSLLIGYLLGILSIISGSKIATTLLVVGIPVLDVLWVIVQRLWRHESPFSHADRKHLHFRLLDIGLSTRAAVLLLYFIAIVFGAIAIYEKSFGKMIGLVALFFLMLIMFAIIWRYSKKYYAAKN